MTNADERLAKFERRLRALAEERQRISEDEKEIGQEMKSQGVTPTEQKGIKLAVKRSFEDAGRRAERISIEEIAESLGDFADSPLGRAAIDFAKVQSFHTKTEERAAINAATAQHTGVTQ